MVKKKTEERGYIDASVFRLSLSKERALKLAKQLKKEPESAERWDDLFGALSDLDNVFLRQVSGCSSKKRTEGAVVCIRRVSSSFEDMLKEIVEVLST